MKIEAEMTVDENGHWHIELPEPIRSQLEGRPVPMTFEIPDDVIIGAGDLDNGHSNSTTDT